LQWRSFRETEDSVVMSIRVLVLEDDERIAGVVVRGLREEGTPSITRGTARPAARP
jgi:hypothetical protein